MTDDLDFWRFIIVKRMNDDGPLYGLHEGYFTKDLVLQAWTDNPYWTEESPSDFYPALDKIEKRYKETGQMPDWAMGWADDELLTVLEHMRKAVKEHPLDEEEQMRAWGE